MGGDTDALSLLPSPQRLRPLDMSVFGTSLLTLPNTNFWLRDYTLHTPYQIIMATPLH